MRSIAFIKSSSESLMSTPRFHNCLIENGIPEEKFPDLAWVMNPWLLYTRFKKLKGMFGPLSCVSRHPAKRVCGWIAIRLKTKLKAITDQQEFKEPNYWNFEYEVGMQGAEIAFGSTLAPKISLPNEKHREHGLHDFSGRSGACFFLILFQGRHHIQNCFDPVWIRHG